MAQGSRIGFVALGCPLATAAFERLLGRLDAEGYAITDRADDGGVVIVNTCGGSAAALEQSLHVIDDVLGHGARVIVTGCPGGCDDAAFAARAQVLAVIRSPTEDAVLRAVRQHLPRAQQSSAVITPSLPLRLTPPHYAYLNIDAGSSQHCSWSFASAPDEHCVSRPIHELMDEAEALVAAGTREIVVIARDVAAYGAELKHRSGFWHGRPLKTSLPGLAGALGEFGVWVRLHAIHPTPVIDELVALMAAGRMLPYLDLSLLHTSPRILHALQRPAATEDMLARVRKWRSICPELAIRATLISGFADETEAEFEDLLGFLRQARFDRVAVLPYAAGAAPAHKLPGAGAAQIDAQRHMRLLDCQEDISTQRLEDKIGRVLTVLVDDIDEEGAIARTAGDAPEIDGVVLIADAAGLEVGEFAQVRITDCDVHDLYAEPR